MRGKVGLCLVHAFILQLERGMFGDEGASFRFIFRRHTCECT